MYNGDLRPKSRRLLISHLLNAAGLFRWENRAGSHTWEERRHTSTHDWPSGPRCPLRALSGGQVGTDLLQKFWRDSGKKAEWKSLKDVYYMSENLQFVGSDYCGHISMKHCTTGLSCTASTLYLMSDISMNPLQHSLTGELSWSERLHLQRHTHGLLFSTVTEIRQSQSRNHKKFICTTSVRKMALTASRRSVLLFASTVHTWGLPMNASA